MVPILDVILEIGLHERSNLCDLICLRRSISAREQSKIGLFLRKDLHTCAKCSLLGKPQKESACNSGPTTKRGGEVKAEPLRKNNFFNFYFCIPFDDNIYCTL